MEKWKTITTRGKTRGHFVESHRSDLYACCENSDHTNANVCLFFALDVLTLCVFVRLYLSFDGELTPARFHRLCETSEICLDVSLAHRQAAQIHHLSAKRTCGSCSRRGFHVGADCNFF